METIIKQFQQIKGVGDVLAGRLVAAGFDTLPRLAAANDRDLEGIKGLPPAAIPEILRQARELAGDTRGEADDRSLAKMLEDAERLRAGVSSLVIRLRDQQSEDDDDKDRRQLRKEITRVLATLERIEASLSEQLRKLVKKLAKADAKLAGSDQGDLETLTRGLRQTRKAIDKIVRS